MVGLREKQYITLSDAKARVHLASARCPACGDRKGAGFAFCVGCQHALALPSRLRLKETAGTADFPDAYRAALQHLRDLPARPLVPGWRYRSLEELDAAGFRVIERSECRSPRCAAALLWMHTPQGGRVAVNLRDARPHRSTCADPGYAERRAAFKKQQRLQASARRRKGAR